MLPEFILYSDFTSPFCYALEECLWKLRVGDRIVWRGVQVRAHRPAPPVSSAPIEAVDVTRATDLTHEVNLVRQGWPDLPIAVPTSRPDTGDAIRAMAAFLLINDARAHSFKQACYRACWRNGLDLSDRRVLYTVAEGVGLARTAFELLDHPHIAEIAALWHQQWDHTGVRRVPALIRRDGAKLVGLTDQHQIRRFLDGNDPDSL